MNSKRHDRPSSRLPTVLLAIVLAACHVQPGLNGRAFVEPEGASGPCFEIDISDGLNDATEITTLFECLNTGGAFDPVRPMVYWLVESEELDSLLSVANGSLETFDLVEAAETASRLLSSPGEPVTRLLDLYVEAYDRGLFPIFLGLLRESADAMDSCEALGESEGDERRAECSIPRMTLALLDTSLLDDVEEILNDVSATRSAEQNDELLVTLSSILVETSTRGGHPRNQILELLSFFLDDEGVKGESPLERLLPHLCYLLSNDLDGDGASLDEGDQDPLDDDLLASLVDHLARLYRDGRLQQLPNQLLVLNTFNSAGDEVGWEGQSIMDELMAITGTLGGDTALLEEEFTLPGSSEPTTVLDLALDTLDSLYLNGADVEEMIDSLQDMVEDQLCEGSASTELCALMEDTLPPLAAAIRTGVGDLLLPVAYVAHQMLDFNRVFDLLDLALELDLLGRMEFFTRISLEHGMLDDTLALFPVLVHEDTGLLTRSGKKALGLIRFFIEPWHYDPVWTERSIVPILVPRAFLLQMISPEYPEADLDRALATIGDLLLDKHSGFEVQALKGLLTELQETMGQEEINIEDLVRRTLENEDLWISALRLARNPELMDLLTPAQDRRGAPWFLYDLIERGMVGRMLEFVAGILDMLIDEGIIDPDSEAD